MIDIEEAITLFNDEKYDLSIGVIKEYAAKGDKEAETCLGFAYQLGLGVTRDINKAADLLESAAKKGSGSAAHNLGTLYLEPALQNSEKSKYWYNQAKSLGFTVAPDEWYE